MSQLSESQILDVISASAGSGKTYTLATRFIDLLVRDPKNYQHILAVTFTIKATAEMMDRIVRDLYILASSTADQKEKQSLINRQKEELLGGRAVDGIRPRKAAEEINGLKDDEIDKLIVENSKIALCLILNDYTQFNISTIDSFVQKVIRAFAFEQGFASNYGVELDTKLVTEKSIDLVMQDMQNDNQLRNWMIDFVKSRMDNDKNWNIDGNIKELAKTITLDEGRIFVEEIGDLLNKDPQILQTFRKRVDTVINETKKEVYDALQEFANNMPAGFAPEMVSGKSKSYSWKMYELAKKSADEIFEQIETWHDKKNDIGKDSRNDIVDNAMLQFQKRINEDLFVNYKTAIEIRKNIFVIGIMSTIAVKMQEYTQQNRTMLMADSNELLNKLIGGSNVPFIYEKIGTRFNHIMIDEFQDTSYKQWMNFEPLLANCLHNNNKCLLVGDVKQAIYRWRNSDWHTLSDLGTEYCRSEINSYVAKNSLDTNWRSFSRIVDFNNKVFVGLRDKISRAVAQDYDKQSDVDIDRIYEKCEQNSRPTNQKEQGYAQLKTIVGGNAEDMQEPVLADLTATIIDLIENKRYKKSDILVLVRKNAEGAAVMDYLAKRGISVVSSDSLNVCNSTLVKGVLAALNFVANRNDEAALLTYMSVANSDKSISQIAHIWKEEEQREQIAERLVKLRGMGLLEMVNAIIRTMPTELLERDFIFIEAFVDTVRSYMTKHHVNLSDFIDYIETVKDNITITAPNNQDAVTIMTIHKSKGLERRVVLIPFADWPIEPLHNKPIVWASNLNAPFNMLKTIPFIYSEGLAGTQLSEAYLTEKRLLYIDSLNLIYVGQTRAKEVLMMWSRMPSLNKDGSYKKNTNIGVFLQDTVGSITTDTEELIIPDANDSDVTYTMNVYRFGELEEAENEIKVDTSKSYEMTPYDFGEYDSHIRLSNRNSKEDDSIDAIEKRQYFIEYGNVMHGIMERIRNIDDIEESVDTALLNGEIDTEKAIKLKGAIKKKMTADNVKRWFDVEKKSVFTETSFFTEDGDLRPDRIVKMSDGEISIIDYKFGFTVDPDVFDEQTEEYHKQVRSYIDTLKRAGFSNVKGYLWYYHKNVIKEVI